MIWTKEQIAKTKADAERARAFVQGLAPGLVREQLEPGLAAIDSAVAAAEAEAKTSRGASGAPVVLRGDVKCLWKGQRTAAKRHVALVGSHLTVGQGNRIEEVINLRGQTAVSQGVAVAVWDGDAIVFRLWLPSAQEALRWALALDAAAQDEGAVDCLPRIQLRIEKQRRAARRRRIGEGFAQLLSRFACCGEAHSGTEKWQLWLARGEEEKAARDQPSADEPQKKQWPPRQTSALGAKIGEVPILLKGMASKEMRHVAIDGDVLTVGREDWCTDQTISLNGAKVVSTGTMLSVWKEDQQLLRMRLEDSEEARCWASALQAAANLFTRPAAAAASAPAASAVSPEASPTGAAGGSSEAGETGATAPATAPAMPTSGEQVLAAHAGLVLKAQKVSAELREVHRGSAASRDNSPRHSLRAGRYKVKSPLTETVVPPESVGA